MAAFLHDITFGIIIRGFDIPIPEVLYIHTGGLLKGGHLSSERVSLDVQLPLLPLGVLCCLAQQCLCACLCSRDRALPLGHRCFLRLHPLFCCLESAEASDSKVIRMALCMLHLPCQLPLGAKAA